MGKILKRSLIMLLCISMIAALCGISAFAEDAAVAEANGLQYTSLSDAFKAVKEGGTVKLLNNVTASAEIDLGEDLRGKTITLDLNEHDITFDSEYGFIMKNYGTFTVKGKGKITNQTGAVFDVSGGTLMDGSMILNIEKDVIVVSNDICIYSDKDGIDTKINVYGTLIAQGSRAAIQGNGSTLRPWHEIVVYDGANISAKTTAIYHPQKGSLKILGGTITGNGCSAIEMRKGTLNISGNPIITSNADEYTVTANVSGATTNGAAVAIAPYDTSTMNISISGGTFTGVKALSYANPNGVTNPVVSINVTGGTFSTDITEALNNAEVTSNLDDISIVEAGGKFTVGSYVAQAGNTKYTSLEAAFKAAEDGSTIKLLSDDTVNNQIVVTDGKTVTLDLGGHNVTSSDSITPFLVEGGELKVTGNGTVTSKLITFRSHANTDPKTMNESPLESILTIDSGVTVVSTGQCAVFYKGSGSVVNVYGTLEAKGPYATISGNGSLDNTTNNGGTVLNINSGAVIKSLGESTAEARDNCAIYHPQSGTINVNGGELSSQYGSGIEMRDGSLNISGGTITSYAGEFTCTPNGNGATTKGAAVAIAMHPNGNRAAKVNITGGKLTAPKALAYSNPNNAKNPDVTINVTGGTFSTDITEALINKEVTSNIDKLAITKDDNGYYTYSESDVAVASVGETTYPSLEAAFAKALTGDTITLLANAKVYSRININNGKKLTLDLGNFNIDNEHSDRLFYVKDGELTVTGQGTVTNNNNDVFVVCGNSNATTWATTAIDSVLTIGEKVKVVSGGDCCIFWQGNGAVANVYGDLTSNGIYATIQGNGSLNDKTNNGGTVLNIFPGASVKATSTATTIYHPQSGTVNVTGGTIDSAEGCGIEMRDGTLNISGDAAVISHADKYESDPNGNGATTVGAAVAIAMYGNGNRVGVLNISGGTFKGVKALSYANPNKVANPNVTINVTGGTFSTDITDALTNAEVKSNIKEYAVAANDDGTYGVKARDEKFENVAAVQRNTNNTLTFLAGINYLDYEKAGFRVTVGNNTEEINTDTVYTELKDNGATSVSADKFSTNYFFAANFEVTDTTIEAFTITPFAKLLNGEVVTGKSTTVKVEKTGGAE